jgi:hypothetical protein
MTTKHITSISDIGNGANFLAIYDEKFSYTEDWYGPPDPPAGRSTKTFTRLVTFTTKEEVVAWYKQTSTGFFGRGVKIFMIEEMSIKTEINITLEK